MCQHLKSKVLETRRRDDHPIIYRRRECDQCAAIFITKEVATDDAVMPLEWQAKTRRPEPQPQPPAAPWYEQWKRKT